MINIPHMTPDEFIRMPIDGLRGRGTLSDPYRIPSYPTGADLHEMGMSSDECLRRKLNQQLGLRSLPPPSRFTLRNERNITVKNWVVREEEKEDMERRNRARERNSKRREEEDREREEDSRFER